jgi:hypothetical protein
MTPAQLEAFAALSRIALRADHMLSCADAALAENRSVNPSAVWRDAERIKQACDEARRALAQVEHRQTMENAQ